MKKISLDDLKQARFPKSQRFKADLKEQLMTRAKKQVTPSHQSNLMKTLFRLSISFAIVTLLITQVALPGNSESSLHTFIQEANAANEAHADEIFYHKTLQTHEMYFENPGVFTGWQTISNQSSETWIAPNGDIRSSTEWTSWDGPLEDGSFNEVSSMDEGIYAQDTYGNFIDYTLLQVIGTDPGEEYGSVEGAPIYNVHPGKQHNFEELEENFLNQLVCVRSEKGDDFTGYTWAVLDERSNTLTEVGGTARPNEAKYNILDELDLAASGRLSTEDVIYLFEILQDEPNVNYEQKTVDGETVHTITLNQKDFLVTSSSSVESLVDLQPNDVIVSFEFNSDYRLTRMTSVTSYQGQERERGSLTVLETSYLDYEENKNLFVPTEEYVAGMMTTRFMDDISEFEDGCYRQYEKLSTDETNAVLENIKTLFDANDLELWEHPLKVVLRYYVLPGDTSVHQEQ